MRCLSNMLLIICIFLTCGQLHAADLNRSKAINPYIPRFKSALLKKELVAFINDCNTFYSQFTENDFLDIEEKWQKHRQLDTNQHFKDQSIFVSNYLKKIKDRFHGLVTEVMLLNDQGVVVAYTNDPVKVYRAQEEKFIKTYYKGSGAASIEEPLYSPSSGRYQIQLSISLVNPDNLAPIGVATLGIDTLILDSLHQGKSHGKI